MKDGRTIWRLLVGIGAYQLQLQLCTEGSEPQTQERTDNKDINKTKGVEGISDCGNGNQDRIEGTYCSCCGQRIRTKEVQGNVLVQLNGILASADRLAED
jgi:hypothetical protein